MLQLSSPYSFILFSVYKYSIFVIYFYLFIYNIYYEYFTLYIINCINQQCCYVFMHILKDIYGVISLMHIKK